MAKAAKFFEKGVVLGAKAGWSVFNKLNSLSPNKSFTPKWSDKPLLKSYQKEKPPLGWPRTTDSLCPRCVPEIRQQIVDGKLKIVPIWDTAKVRALMTSVAAPAK